MFLIGEVTEYLSTDDNDDHNNGVNGYGNDGGDLSASDPEKAVGAERRHGGSVHILTIVYVSILTNTNPKVIK